MICCIGTWKRGMVMTDITFLELTIHLLLAYVTRELSVEQNKKVNERSFSNPIPVCDMPCFYKPYICIGIDGKGHTSHLQIYVYDADVWVIMITLIRYTIQAAYRLLLAQVNATMTSRTFCRWSCQGKSCCVLSDFIYVYLNSTIKCTFHAMTVPMH